MHKGNQGVQIEISGGALIFSAMLLLILPLQWFFAVILAGMFHELCHGCVTILLGGNIESMTIGARGTVMKATALSPSREVIASLAGPLGSLSLLLLAKWMPRTAICGLIHGVYNLIPLMPLDGGQILRTVLYAFLAPPKAIKTLSVIQRSLQICVTILCCVFMGKMSIITFALVIFIFWRRRR